MITRKLTTIRHLKELNLKPETLRVLLEAGVKVEELITAARNDAAYRTYVPWRTNSAGANQLTAIPGIGDVRAEEIITVVDEAGFILHESEASRSARRLLASTLGSPTVLLEHYEDLEDMAPEALQAVDDLIHEVLVDRELRVVQLRFGFEDGKCHTLQECADILGVTKARANQFESKALVRLRPRSRRLRLEVATCYSRKALRLRMADLWSEIDKLRQELDGLKEATPYAELKSGFTPLEELGLSRRTYTPLVRVGISSVEELGTFSDEDLLLIRNFGQQGLDEVHEALAKRSA